MSSQIHYNVTDYGADPLGKEISTWQIAKAIEACHRGGGGTVFFPAGNYKTGAIELKSNINLTIGAGANVSFVSDSDAYPVIETRWEGADRECHASCVYAVNAENISITGRGTLDGNGKYWWEIFRTHPLPRPKLIGFDTCKNVLIEGVTLKNSPAWTIHPLRCDCVTIDKVIIRNPKDSPNTDGINPESCQNVHISNCHIDVGDDCITLKSGTEESFARIPCENITITNCTMVHGHGGVVIGSEMTGSVRNVTISNCVFDGTDRGIRLKTRRERGGIVEDILVNNVYMRNVISPFIMNMYYFCGPRGKENFVSDKNPYPVTDSTPTFRNISLSNITAREVHACAGFIYGLAENFIEGISINNMSVSFAENAVAAVPAMMDGIPPMAKKGFFISNVRHSSFHNIKISGHEGETFTLGEVSDMSITDCTK